MSSPFLLDNQVKLKSPRPPQFQNEEKSQVIFNLIKRKQEKPTRKQEKPVPKGEKLDEILDSTDISVFPLFLKDKVSRKVEKSRQKRWIPFKPLFENSKKKARSSQMPQRDEFLNFIQKKPQASPVNR